MNQKQKEDFLIKFIKRKLSKNIDISNESISVGKTLFKNTPLDDTAEEEIFIELYAEIPVYHSKNKISLEDLSNVFNENIENLILNIKKLIKERIEYIIYAIFNSKIQENAPDDMKYIPRMQDTELDIGVEKNLFIIQINLIADLEAA